MPPTLGHLCLLLPFLSLSAVPLDPRAECWWPSGVETRSALPLVFPRFLLPSAGQKQSNVIIKATLPSSAPNRRTQLIGKYSFQWMQGIVWAHYKSILQRGILAILKKIYKRSIVNHDNWYSRTRHCFLYNKENTTLGTGFPPCFLLQPLSTSSLSQAFR